MARDSFRNSPLFSIATRQITESARRAFRRTDVGQMVAEAERIRRSGVRPTEKLTDLANRYARRMTPGSVTQRLMHSQAGQLAQQIERYAKGQGASKALLNSFFDVLGPAGALLRSLIGVGKRSTSALNQDLDVAQRLLRAFGYEVLPPKERRAGTRMRAQNAARQYLEDLGYTVLDSGEAPGPRPTKFPFGISERTRTGQPRKTVSVPYGPNTKRFRADDPVVTGEMVKATSSNVWAYGYDIESEYLYIQFRQPNPDKPGEKLAAPGPLYRYHNVPPEIFQRMHRAASKGTFVWDAIRIRGTHSGHRFDYALVGVQGTYVPRKATLTPRGEEFLQRRVRTQTGSVLQSLKPDELVRPLGPRTFGAMGPGGARGPGGPR